MEHKLRKRFGRNVHAWRLAAGLNKSAFCNAIIVSRPQLNAIEAGKANVTLDTLERMAAHMGIDPLYLLADMPAHSDFFFLDE